MAGAFIRRAAVVVLAFSVLAVCYVGPAAADPADDTAAWLNKIGLKRFGKMWTVKGVRNATHVSLRRAKKFDSKEMAHLKAMTQLRSLELGDPRYGDAALAVIGQLGTLTSLRVGNASVTKAGLAKLGGLTKLQRLQFSHAKIGPEAMPTIARFKSLVDLNLGLIKVGDSGLKALGTLPRLRALSIGSADGITRNGWATLAAMPALTTLNLFRVKIGPGFEALGKAGRLEAISITGSNLDDAGAAVIGRIKTLTSVVIYDTQAGDKGIRAIAKLPKLERLNISGTKVTNAGVKGLGKAQVLRRLSLDNTAVTDPGISHLKGLPKLSFLLLSRTRITDASVEALASIKSLRFVSLYGTRITRQGAAKLKSLAPRIRIRR